MTVKNTIKVLRETEIDEKLIELQGALTAQGYLIEPMLGAQLAKGADSGGRAVIGQAERKPDQPNDWLKRLPAGRNKNVAAVALATKNARCAWALLAHARSHNCDYLATRAAA